MPLYKRNVILIKKEEEPVIKVKTFASPLKIFQTAKELQQLDDEVNKFIAGQKAKRVISVSDTCTSDNTGTIGIIRVLTYETA